MALAAFKTDEEALAFLRGGPQDDGRLDIAPEADVPLPPLDAVEAPMPGAIEPNVKAVMDEADANGEPPLPVEDQVEQEPGDQRTNGPRDQRTKGLMDQGTEGPNDLTFQSDEDALAWLKQSAPSKESPDKAPEAMGFQTDDEALAFLKAGSEPPPPSQKPVTTPEAADGADVTFDPEGPAFKFTGTLIVDPSSGPTAGIDGMQPVMPQGPMADDKMPGPKEAAFNREPRLVPDGGQVVFDTSTPERFTQGVEEAYSKGLLPEANYAKIKLQAADIFKVVDERKKLEARAHADPRLLSVMQGLGRGGAATVGAVAGGKLGAGAGAAVAGMTGVGAPLIPAVAAVTGTAGAIAGGISAAVGYDALYGQLAKHFDQYDAVMKAAELYPMHNQAGELTMAAVALPVSLAQGARGLSIVADQARREGMAVAPAVLKQAGAAAGAGAVTGAAAYPINAAVEGEPITARGIAEASGTGALMGGFFINNRVAGTKDFAAVAAKMKAGQTLTAAEAELARAAAPSVRAAFAEVEAAGGRRMSPGYDAEGKWNLNDPEVSAPVTSVAGFMPRVGAIKAKVPYEIPLRLPEGAMRRAQEFAATKQQPVAVTAAETSPVVRQAPVNVMPPGTEAISTPPPMTPAMMAPDNFAALVGTERGIDMDWNPEATTELFKEHFRIVRDAVNAQEPVNSEALDLYEMRVPYYVRDEATGLAVFDQPSFEVWQQYVGGQAAEARQEIRDAGGVELLDAIRQLGGLPAPKSGQKKAVWSGELKALWESSRGGRDIGVKGAVGLFRNDAPDIDDLVTGLRQKGFRLETEADLLEMLDNRLRSGSEIYGMPVVAAEPPPVALKGRRPATGALGELEARLRADWPTFSEEQKLQILQALREKAGVSEPVQTGDVEPPPVALKGRRPVTPAPGEPRQMNLLGEDQGGFQLVGQTDKTSLTPQEMQQRALEDERKAEAERMQGDLFGAKEPMGAVSTDPLTPPARLQAGGPAKVPPGQPMGAGAAQLPDWVLGPAETRDGRRLVKGVENYKPGQRWGFRAIVDYVNKAVRMEMRRSRSQTSKVHPAHYKPAHHMAYTRDTQSQINFHEAGHGLEYLIRARVPGFFNAFSAELVALTKRNGSMASNPPSNARAAAKADYTLGEGVAEWTRLLMTEPEVVAGLKVTAAISEVAEKFYPGLAASLRDGARAVQRFQTKPVAERWSMFNADPSVTPSANEIIGTIIRGGQGLMAKLASGAPVSRLDRSIARAIVKNRDQVEMTYRQALAKMRDVRAKTTTPLMQAHNMILAIGAEATNAIAGSGPGKGLRLIGKDGKFKQFTEESWRDLRRKIPGKLLPIFDEAAWALESLTRWEASRMEYPGLREGVSPDDLRLIVSNARRTLRNRGINFDERFAEQSAFFGEILNIKDFGGLKKPGEVDRMTQRDTYWPLPRVMQDGRGRAGKGRGDIQAGDYRARGSSEAIRQTDEVAEERVRAAYEAYYWNRFLNMLADRMGVVAKDQSLPIEARSIAGAAIVPLEMPMKVAATISKEEVIPWVLSAIADKMEPLLGFRPDLTPDDINLSWNFKDVWRPTKPGDVNVVSSLRGGERVFYQLGDPGMFGMFSNPQTTTKGGKFLGWALGPMMQNWKRNITQGQVFAVRSLFRDIFSQSLLNPDAVAWVPGYTHVLGAVNKWTNKYPQVFQEGLLLSRLEPGSVELVNKVRHGAIWQWITEGWYVSQAKDPVVKLLATVLQPSNWLFPLWKVGDLINLFGGRQLAQYFETAGREGAAVAVLKRGGTDEEALMKYWTAAGQFNEHAGVADMRVMMSIPGFFNPMLQSTRNVVQKLTDPDPAVAGTAWARLLMMMPMLFAGAAVAKYLFMDGRDKDRERKRAVDDRMNFMDLGGFSVPFPFGVEGVMGSVVYNAVLDDLLDRPKVEADRTAWMLLKRIFDPGSPLSVFGPQISTLTEASMNWSTYRQKHIVSPWMANLPASEQYYSTTPEFYRKLGQWMDYSPAKLQYITQQAISRQADEVVRFMESLDGGRPMQEPADVPFVGRMFVREPLGFSSQPMRDAERVETSLRKLDMRLQAKGWYALRDANFPTDQLTTPQMRQLHEQLRYLETLRWGLRRSQDISALAKAYALAENWPGERNARQLLTTFTQSLLLGNKDMIDKIDVATELLQQIPDRSPQEKAAEYLDRRF